ncbi:MAG TPA: ATP-binding protein [Rhizomicrobium sp.]|jgi:signal transduction histidine kinase|nr:ATP-binding protein [Rhizomicrobium sp.]
MVRRFKFWPSTLAVQLIAVTAAAVALSNIAVAFWFEYSNELQSESALTERVLDRATAVATTLSSIPSSSRQVLMDSMSSRIWRFTEIPTPSKMLPMTDAEVRLARRIDEQLPDSIPNQRKIEVQLDEPVNTVSRSQIPENPAPHTGMVRMLVPVDKNTMLNTVFLRPAAPWPVEIIVATVVAILLASAGGAFMARRIVRPLSELTDAASAVARGSGAPHVAENGPEDVRKAAAAFNTMAGKVTRTLESQRHLLSAVGHDLRTPITAMRINLEFVEDDDLREGLLRNLDELQALTEQVLSAARGTGGEIKRNVDLSALVESLCTDMDEIGEPVSWVNHAPAPVSCRPNEIRRAVRNLVENAVAYGARADVRIADSGDGYEILVEDEGPGIPEDDRQRVFEPFVRLESSRNEETGGTGLGLTLVKAIAEGHGGAVTLENRPGGGLRVRLHLPRMAASA